MKDLVLDQTLIIGIDEIDDDHGKLINLFNILNHSVTEGAPTD
jgi:hemerythrin